MAGAVKPKLGHCHLRKLFDRKESLATIKLFLQKTLSRRSPPAPSAHYPLCIQQLRAFVFSYISLDPKIFPIHRKKFIELFIVVDKKLSILLDGSFDIYIYYNRKENLKFFPVYSSRSSRKDLKEFWSILCSFLYFARDEISSILSKKYARKEQRVTRVICKAEIDRQ